MYVFEDWMQLGRDTQFYQRASCTTRRGKRRAWPEQSGYSILARQP